MIRIERAAEHIAAFVHVVFTALFGVGFGVVMALTQRSELIDVRKRLCGQALFPAAFRYRGAVVDNVRRFYLANLQTRLAQRMHLQFISA